MTGRPIRGETRIRLRTQATRPYLAGDSIPSVATQIGVSYGTARTLLLEAGVRPRKQGGFR